MKRWISLAFVIVLYIGPMIFIPYSITPAIGKDRFAVEDFAPSELEYEIHLATDGEGSPSETGDYTDTHTIASAMFALDASSPYDCYVELEFELPEEEFDAIYLNFYGNAESFLSYPLTTRDILVYNGTDWIDFGNIESGEYPDWTNVTLDSSYVHYLTNTVYMRARATDDAITTVYAYYAEVVLCNFTENGEWISKNWDYRKAISIEGASGAGCNYQVQVNVTFETGMQADFDDIRFRDNNGVTALDCWLESYTASTNALFWVEVKDDLDTDQIIYMYYGNDDASTTSDGEATFLLFDDFEDNNLDNWDDTDNMQTTSARTHDSSSYSASWTADANAHLKDNGYNLSGIRISFWVNQEDTLRGSFNYVYSVDDYSENVATIRGGYETGTSPMYYRDTGVYTAYPSSVDDINADEWDKLEFAVDFTNDTMQTWQNGVANGVLAIVEDDGTALETEVADGVGLQMQGSYQCWIDDVIVRKWVDVEPIASIGERTETAPPRAWELVGEMDSIFSVELYTWGFDMLLIFGGLILIPLSILYLAYGSKNNMNTDKLLYGLLAFVVGWGLFLGGIMG